MVLLGQAPVACPVRPLVTLLPVVWAFLAFDFLPSTFFHTPQGQQAAPPVRSRGRRG
jgi:hypothetical protein